MATVSIRDTGIGIPTEEIPKIFDRFYRVDKARSRALGGSGLGLSIAKWIADAHGGKIEVQSESHRGSTFTVYLPVDSSTSSS
jgi:signal transduction histidine kinase